mgnify:CR=1 FL=1
MDACRKGAPEIGRPPGASEEKSSMQQHAPTPPTPSPQSTPKEVSKFSTTPVLPFDVVWKNFGGFWAFELDLRKEKKREALLLFEGEGIGLVASAFRSQTSRGRMGGT